MIPSLKGGKGLDTRQKEWLEGGKGKGGDLRRREKYEQEEENLKVKKQMHKVEKKQHEEERQKVKKQVHMRRRNRR